MQEYIAYSSNGEYDLRILVDDDADLGGVIRVFSIDDDAHMMLNGWEWTFERIFR